VNEREVYWGTRNPILHDQTGASTDDVSELYLTREQAEANSAFADAIYEVAVIRHELDVKEPQP